MANKIINKFKEPKFTEFSRKDLVVDIKNGALYYKSNLGVHRITSQLTSDTFGSEDIINVYQNFVTTFHQTGQRTGDSTITGNLTITQDNIIFGDISFNSVTPRSGTDVPIHSNIYSEFTGSVGLTGSFTASNGSTLLTGSNTLFSSSFEDNDFLIITSGSYSQSFTIAKVHSDTSMSLNTSWSGNSISSSYSGYTNTGPITLSTDPDLLVVKSSNNINRLVLDKRGNLSISGIIPDNIDTFIDYRYVSAPTGSITASFGSTLITGSGTVFQSVFGLNELIKISTGSYSQTFRIAKVHSNTSMSLDSQWLGGGSGSILSMSFTGSGTVNDFQESSSLLFFKDPNLFKVKASDGKVELNVNSRGDLDIDGRLYADLTSATSDRVVYYNTTTDQLTHGSISSLGDQLSSSGYLGGVSGSGLTPNDTFKFTGQRSGSSSITGSLILSGSDINLNVLGDITSSQNILVEGDATILGTITAQEFHTEFVSASIIYESGSTKFGDTQDDSHDFTGSLNLSGSVNIQGSGNITASGDISASGDIYASNVYMPSGSKIYFDIADAADQYIGMINANDLEIYGDQRIEIRAAQETHFVKADGTPKVTIDNLDGSISASGKINASSSIVPLLDNIVVQNLTTGEFNTYTNPGLISSSAQIGTDISGAFTSTSASIATDIATNSASIAININNISTLTSVTSSYALEANISGAFTSTSASLAADIATNSASIAILTEGNTDNLGDHTATQDLNMSGFNIDAAQHITASGNISASGLLFASSSVGNYSDVVVQDLTTGRFYTTSSAALTTTLPSGLLSSSAQIASDISGAIDAATGSLLSNTTFISSSQQITDLGFSQTTGTVTSVTSGDANTISIGGTAVDPTVSANTSAVINGSTNLATGDQIFDFVTGQGYFVGTSADISGAIDAATSSLSASLATSITNVSADTFKSTGQRNGDSVITGSLFLSGSSGHLTASGDISASGKMFGGLTLQTQANVVFYDTTTGELTQDSSVKLLNATGVVSSSAQVLSGSGIFSSSAQFETDISGAINAATSSILNDYGLLSSSAQIFSGSGLLSSSAQIATDISGAFTSTSASIATDITTNSASIAININNINTLTSATGSYALEANISGAFTSTSASIATDITTNTNNISTLTSATSSYALEANISGAFTSTSASIATDIATNSASIATNVNNINTLTGATGSYALEANISGAFTSTSASIATDITTNSSSIAINTTNINTLTSVTSSYALEANISGAFTSTSASIATDITTNSASIADLTSATGSFLLNTTDTLDGDLTVTGTITAQEFHTEFVSASIIFESGSTQFGNSSDDVHTFSGSVNVKDDGHITASGNISSSGNILASNVYLPGDGRISFDDDSTNDQYITGTDNALTIVGDNRNNIRATTETRFQTLAGANYASIKPGGIETVGGGAISSSGALYGVLSNTNQANAVFYNTTTKELTYDTAGNIGGGLLSSSAQIASDISGAFTSTSASIATDITTNTTAINALPTAATVSGSFLLNTTDTLTGDLTVTGNVSASTAHFTGDVEIESDSELVFLGTAGGGNSGVQYLDAGSVARYGLLFPGSDVVALANRASNGVVQIRANTSTAGGAGEETVAEFQDDKVIINTDLSASGNLFGNLTDAGGSFNNTVMYDTSTGRLYFTGSYGGGAGGSGTVTSVTSITTNQLTVANTTSTPEISIVTGSVTENGTALATGDQIYDFVTGQGYITEVVEDLTPQLGGNLDALSKNILNVKEIGLQDKIYHDGDVTTYLEFASDVFRIVTNNTERAEFSNTAIIFNETGADVDFRVEGDSNVNLIRTNAADNRVGIGTTPDTDFHVDGDTKIEGTVHIDSAESELPFFIESDIDVVSSNTNNFDEYQIAVHNFNGNIGAFAGIAFDATNALNTTSGNIGSSIKSMNTSSIAGNHKSDLIFSTNGNNINPTEKFRIKGSGPIILQDGSGTWRTTLTNAGNYFIIEPENTGAPTAHNGTKIIGDLFVNYSHVNSIGNIEAEGDVIAFATSDKRLKDNITPISNPIEKLLQIGGYTFDWNENQNTYKGHDVGVIAQEIEKVLPEVVEERKTGYKAVKYEKIVPLLIEAIKDQQKQIDELKEMIDNGY